jgi:hypothetical protein
MSYLAVAIALVRVAATQVVGYERTTARRTVPKYRENEPVNERRCCVRVRSDVNRIAWAELN